jgi:hypothetical protein
MSTKRSRRVSFADGPDRPTRTPSPVIINLGEIHLNRSPITHTALREYGSAHTHVNDAARSGTRSTGSPAPSDTLAEMRATISLRERALELTEARFATAVRRAQELEKELFELKEAAKQRLPPTSLAYGDVTVPQVCIPAPGQQVPPLLIPSSPLPVQRTLSPTLPPAYTSPITPYPPPFVWNSSGHIPPPGFKTIYVDVDFMVDHTTGRVTPLQVRPHNSHL